MTSDLLQRRRRPWIRLVSVAAGLWLLACGGGRQHAGRMFANIGAEHDPPAASVPLQVQWFLDLVPEGEGAYIPVERAGAATDLDSGRVYVGSSQGVLWTLALDGQTVREHAMGAAIEAPPVADPRTGMVWAAAVTGKIHALSGRDGKLMWEATAGGPVSTPMLLSDDALYVATDDDNVVAFNRRSGEILWRHNHDGDPGELSIAGHAGLLRDESRIVTAFSDGTVIALDLGDGRELWHLDTSIDADSGGDLGAFIDVDTTPVRIGDRLYVASFAAGLYVLDARRGVVRERHPQYLGITGLAANEHSLVLSSADAGVVCVDLASMTPRWIRPARVIRGAPTAPRIHDGQVYVGESRGALLVLALGDGRELARVESGHGYSAAPILSGHRGFALTNTARLLSFLY